MTKGIVLAMYCLCLFSRANASDWFGYTQLTLQEDNRSRELCVAPANQSLYHQVHAIDVEKFLRTSSSTIFRIKPPYNRMREEFRILERQFSEARTNLLDLRSAVNALYEPNGLFVPLSDPDKETISRLKQKCKDVKQQMSDFEKNLRAIEEVLKKKETPSVPWFSYFMSDF